MAWLRGRYESLRGSWRPDRLRGLGDDNQGQEVSGLRFRERAVRLVLEHRREYPNEWAAITSIAQKCGMTAETLRKWVRQAESR